MLKKFLLLLFLISLVVACNNDNKTFSNGHKIKTIPSKGKWRDPDSVAKPITLLAGIPKSITAGKPLCIPTNLNVHIALEPTPIIAGAPIICVPGKDTFLIPKTTTAIDSAFTAGIPEVVEAKDMVNRDLNPAGFSSFSKLQGLKDGTILSMLQDKKGNLWLGTGLGVTRFDGRTFTNFTTKEGLLNNSVYEILEDRNGNLWFGTNGAVTKYDGKSFTNYTEEQGLKEATVLNILEDKKGNIWFCTYGGVSKYDGHTFTSFSTKEGLAGDVVFSALQDRKGNLWFGTDQGTSKYDGKSFYNFTTNQGLSNNSVYSIIQDKQENIWFATDGGLTKYDGKNFINFSEKEGLIKNSIFSLFEDKAGNIWCGTLGSGACKYQPASIHHPAQFTNYTENEGLTNNTVNSILEDTGGNIWFGTDEGVVKNDEAFTHYTEKEGFCDKDVRATYKDSNGDIWFGTYGSGVIKYDGSNFYHLTTKEGLSSDKIRGIARDKAGNFWFATNEGISKYDGKTFSNFTEKEGLLNKNVISAIADKKGNLWFGTLKGVSKFDGKSFTNFSAANGLANSKAVWSEMEDKAGNIWFGSFNGVSKYDGKSFTNFTEKEGLENTSVTDIIEDKHGNIWFATVWGGAVKFDGNSLTNYTEDEGLSNNVVYTMLTDKAGNLWFGNSFGLSELSEKKWEAFTNKSKPNKNTYVEGDILFKNYLYADGFLGVTSSQNKSMIEDNDNNIWIGTKDRLTVLHPKGISEDTLTPNIQITGLQLYNESITWLALENKKDSILKLGNGVIIQNFEFSTASPWYHLPMNLSLAYNNNYITFNFTGITMNHSRLVKYKYKLEGNDENWSAITNRTEAPYGNLPSGTYTFKVKAMNSEGYWSNEASYSFTIRPPFWQTWWFRTAAVLILVICIWWYIKRREKKLVSEKETLEKIVEERTAEVLEEKIIVETQKHLLEEKHKEITDSINYAERIQRSFLATKELLDENLNEHFVFFQPKDVVSGDFYWASKIATSQFLLVTADSTGHGVPGAIMSILNISCLKETVKAGVFEPSEILNNTRKLIIETLKKDGSAEGGKDGMDCSVISFDFKNKTCTYAAANNPIWIIRDGKLIEFAADKMPVGKHDKDHISFLQNSISLCKNDIIYTITDGMADQFGGPKGKKFMYKQLKEILIMNAHLSMNEQKEKLAQAFHQWKGNMEQVDDVTIIGIKA